MKKTIKKEDRKEEAVLEKQIKQIERRWTKKITGLGWTALPSVILRNQKKLGLRPIDVNVLMQLLVYWWDKENLPHPAKKLIAQQIGVTARSVQRSVAYMEDKGLISRKQRRNSSNGLSSNNYDFTGLIEKVTPYADQEIQEKKAKQKG